jgi:CRP/FNR family cyclic AMP-dependent transcriptional regulator
MRCDEVVIDKRMVLRRHEFFREASPAVVDRLAAHARLVSYPAGGRIFRKNDPGSGLVAVVSGLVRISVPSHDDREIVLNLIGPHEIFGEVALLDGNARTADATAVTRCQLLVLDRRDFMAVLAEEPAFANRVLALVSRRLRRTSEQVEDLIFSDLPTRLAKALLRLAELQSPGDTRQGRIAITQKELGRTIGFSRESTNKCLREWEEAGYVALEKGACTIRDRAFLVGLASEMQPPSVRA